MHRILLIALVCGCADSEPAADTAPTDGLAPLTTPSAGCPAFEESGEPVTITSGGLERQVTVVFPKDVAPNAPVLFSFHGLGTPSQDPMGSLVAGFKLQIEANARDAIFVVPEARASELPLVGLVSLWGILDDEDPDLQLFDDLRTCVIEAFDADPRRVGAWGHSGGALWTTVVGRERADALASIVELSGGASIELPVIGGPFVDWDPVGRDLPALLVTGGETDVWPDVELTLIDFGAATETLSASLVEEGQHVGRCDHGAGHFNIPPDTLATALDWLVDHRFGEASPVDALPDECWWPDAALEG